MAKVTIVNVETGEVIERDETTEETLYRQKIAEEHLADTALREAAKAQADAAKQAVLTKLGLTADEVAALLS
jgi:hypothetical protein